MTPWSIVAVVAILCTAVVFCWGLWLNAIYPNGLPPEEQEFDPGETGVYPSEETTGTWEANPSSRS